MVNQNFSSIFVGMRGSFSATGPFTSRFNKQLNYTCIAIEDINGLIARGHDPYNDIYLANGLSSEQYFSDDSTGVPIYTFQSNVGDIIALPGSNIVGMPDSNGVRYSNVMLGISLSAVPDNFDLTPLKREISDMVFNRIGVRSEVRSIVFGTPSIISQMEHRSVENARMGNVSNNQSILSTVNVLTNQNSSLLSKVTQLEGFIKNII